jgi:integrase
MAKRRRDRFAAGRYLEEHGNKFRVVLRVPPSLVSKLGKTKLKETLNATSRAEADVMKWPVLARLKSQIAEAKAGRGVSSLGNQQMKLDASTSRPHTPNSLVREAMDWRREMERERQQVRAGKMDEEDVTLEPILDHCVEQIHYDIGEEEAALFADIASGSATPFAYLVDEWLREEAFAGRTEAAYRQAINDLTLWCENTDTPATVEAITKRVAGQFITTRFIVPKAAPATANKAITALASFWRWMNKRGHIDQVSPWAGQFLSKSKRSATTREAGEAAKRPFEDDEVATLLRGLTDPLLADFCQVAALTGMRREEIATLRVRHLRNGIIKVPGTKTAAAAREIPMHSVLAPVMARRILDKGLDDYLFHELPDQQNSARARGAPVSQAFTRQRRALGVDDRREGERQSRIDLHSFRRWFIRKAREALEGGATGFTAWTIADVVGHSREEGPLGMTMGRYPGRADMRALRACVEAVRLPQVLN